MPIAPKAIISAPEQPCQKPRFLPLREIALLGDGLSDAAFVITDRCGTLEGISQYSLLLRGGRNLALNICDIGLVPADRLIKLMSGLKCRQRLFGFGDGFFERASGRTPTPQCLTVIFGRFLPLNNKGRTLAGAGLCFLGDKLGLPLACCRYFCRPVSSSHQNF